VVLSSVAAEAALEMGKAVRLAGFVLMGRRSPGLCSERLEEQRGKEQRTDLGPWGMLLLSVCRR